MELWQEMLCSFFKNEVTKIRFPRRKKLDKLLQSNCYLALAQIKDILCNDELKDKECFMKIEEIISVFESLGRSCGSRHDFG